LEVMSLHMLVQQGYIFVKEKVSKEYVKYLIHHVWLKIKQHSKFLKEV